ncbi:MAG: signal peptidase II [Ruminococcaceae bacterium]|nr:signal peptidase II [Oscillospiraceae bacterium]
MWLYFLVIAGVVALDQASKWLVMLNMELHESIDVIAGVFRFTYIRNDGSAFGMFSEHRWVFLVLSTIGIAAVLFYLIKFRPKEKLMWIPLAMIAGGGIGNMIDRLFYGDVFGNGTVVDFLDFCLIPNVWMWIFNVADAFVCVGAGILFAYLLLDILREFREEKRKKNHG